MVKDDFPLLKKTFLNLLSEKLQCFEILQRFHRRARNPATYKDWSRTWEQTTSGKEESVQLSRDSTTCCFQKEEEKTLWNPLRHTMKN